MAFNSTPQAVHVDEYLTNYAINFAQEQNYLATQVFPVINVEKQSDKYYVFDAAEENREFKDLVTKASARTLPNMFEITQSVTLTLLSTTGLVSILTSLLLPMKIWLCALVSVRLVPSWRT